MWNAVFRDPKVRRTYILTKAAVFVLAAAATWPLSSVIGNKAWIGLGVFGVILAGLTLVVLGAGAAVSETGTAEEEEAEDDEEADPSAPVVLPIEDSLDLHPFPPRDVPAVVADYLEVAHARGFREVRLIHGRGIGVQRERVRSLLAGHELVDSYHDAPPTRGGWGATVAYLTENVERDGEVEM